MANQYTERQELPDTVKHLLSEAQVFMKEDLAECKSNIKQFPANKLNETQKRFLNDYLLIPDLEQMPVLSIGDYADCLYNSDDTIVLWHRTTIWDGDYWNRKVEVKFYRQPSKAKKGEWLTVKIYQPRSEAGQLGIDALLNPPS